MSLKRIQTAIIIFLLLFFGIAITNTSWHVNIDSVHQYDNIHSFQKESGLQFYDLYHFQKYIDNHEKQLLSTQNNFTFHFNEEYPTRYSYFSSNISYNVDFHFTDQLIYRDYHIEHIDNTTLYMYSYENHYYFIVIEGNLKYEFNYKNMNHFLESEIIQKAKEYIQLNKDYHRKK